MLCKKELTFEFFKNNPETLYEIGENENYKLFGIRPSTYKRYLFEYRSIHEANREVKQKEIERNIYYKNRVRQRFLFDDSRLFGF